MNFSFGLVTGSFFDEFLLSSHIEILPTFEWSSSILFPLMMLENGQFPREDDEILDVLINADRILGLAAGELEGDFNRHPPDVLSCMSTNAAPVMF